MALTPGLRKLVLTAHVISSVGWFGAVSAFLVLAVAGQYGRDVQLVSAVYLAMSLIGWYAIVPLAVLSLLTGIVSSLGTKWGLIRHYWLLVKLLLTIFITVLLLVHMQPVDALARAAAKGSLFSAAFDGVRLQMVVYAVAGMVALVVLAGLSTYKPPGMTRYGWRKQQEERLDTKL